MRFVLLLATVVLSACAGDTPPPSGKCTGATYDPCNEEHDCTSNICQNFAAEGFQVCTQTCDDQTPCPGEGTCDTAIGMCKPAAPTECTL